jgi:Na+-transporting methylmalonyl-CoA/oxaloacetate decarboxylase gamma subunit
MWEAAQISIAGICAVMAGISLLYLAVRAAGYLAERLERKGGPDG